VLLSRTSGLGTGLALAFALATGDVMAQPADNLAAARSLFGEAVQDEDAGRFAVALLKFEKVREVRDTAPVEFRIASCHEGLGEGPQAAAAYGAAVTLGADDPRNADVVQAAHARLDALARQGISAPTPALMAAPTPTSMPALTPAPAPALTPPHHDAWRTAGWIAAGSGAVLVAASAVLLIVRHEDIAALDRDCPGGLCGPGVDRGDVESTRSRALVEGPVAVACGVAGLAAAGVGVVALVARPDAVSARRDPDRLIASSTLAPMPVAGGAGMAIVGTFR
jgi:hypothetical protein